VLVVDMAKLYDSHYETVAHTATAEDGSDLVREKVAVDLLPTGTDRCSPPADSVAPGGATSIGTHGRWTRP
jgi:hypothetical protein